MIAECRVQIAEWNAEQSAEWAASMLQFALCNLHSIDVLGWFGRPDHRELAQALACGGATWGKERDPTPFRSFFAPWGSLLDGSLKELALLRN